MTLIDLAQATAISGDHGRPALRVGGIGGQHGGRTGRARRTGRLHRGRGRRRGRAHLRGDLRAAGVVVEPAYGGSPEGDALGTGRCMVLISDDAERTMGTYLGAASTLTVAGVSTALRRAGLGRAARGLPLGRGGGQGGHASCRRHCARSRRLGRPVAVGPVLRRAAPAGVPRPPGRRHRHPAGQRRGDHHAVRGGLAHGCSRGGRGDRAARRHDPGRRGHASC